MEALWTDIEQYMVAGNMTVVVTTLICPASWTRKLALNWLIEIDEGGLIVVTLKQDLEYDVGVQINFHWQVVDWPGEAFYGINYSVLIMKRTDHRLDRAMESRHHHHIYVPGHGGKSPKERAAWPPSREKQKMKTECSRSHMLLWNPLCNFIATWTVSFTPPNLDLSLSL